MTAKKIQYLVIHCTATPEGRKVTRQDIYDWHIKGRGWSRLGYSDMIHIDGRLENLTPYDDDDLIESHEMTWGVKGINAISRHVVYVGGLDKHLKPKDTRTPAQKETLADYVRFMVKLYPWIKVAGHNRFANKACPCFDWKTWLRSIGIADKNIAL
jgi:N-acetylmuramoyl-L-alanine amidase